MSSFKGSVNPCDILVYVDNHLFLIETKSTHKNTFSITDEGFPQYERLKSVDNLKVNGLHPMLVLWFIEHDKIIAFPIQSVIKMREEDNLKSINIKTYMEYDHIDIPSKKLRTFMDSNYTCMLEYYKNLDKEKEVKE